MRFHNRWYWQVWYLQNARHRKRVFPGTLRGEIKAALYADMRALDWYGENAVTNFLVKK